MAKITPTVGRVVLFHPGDASTHPSAPSGATLAAIIAKVRDDGTLNLGVLDENGNSFSATSVTLIQDGDKAPEGGFYAEWMPYQKSVAAGTLRPTLHADPADKQYATSGSN